MNEFVPLEIGSECKSHEKLLLSFSTGLKISSRHRVRGNRERERGWNLRVSCHESSYPLLTTRIFVSLYEHAFKYTNPHNAFTSAPSRTQLNTSTIQSSLTRTYTPSIHTHLNVHAPRTGGELGIEVQIQIQHHSLPPSLSLLFQEDLLHTHTRKPAKMAKM